MLWLEPEEGLLRGACTAKYRQFRGGQAQHGMGGGEKAPWAFAALTHVIIVLCSRWLLVATLLGCAFVMFADIDGRHSWRVGWIEAGNTDCGMNLKASRPEEALRQRQETSTARDAM